MNVRMVKPLMRFDLLTHLGRQWHEHYTNLGKFDGFDNEPEGPPHALPG